MKHIETIEFLDFVLTIELINSIYVLKGKKEKQSFTFSFKTLDRMQLVLSLFDKNIEKTFANFVFLRNLYL